MGIASPQDFKKKARSEITLPSGSTIQVKKVDSLKAFMGGGGIPNSLIPLVQSAIKQGTTEELDKKIADMNFSDLEEVSVMMDNVNIQAWVMPKLYPIPEDEVNRSEEYLYIDEVDMEDKLFVFQWVTGGTQDIAQFRNELGTNVEHLVNLKDVESSTPPAISSPPGERPLS